MFREAFFILIMRGDYDGLPAFHILGLGGKGTLPVDAVFLPDSHTKYGQRAGIAWLSPTFVHLFPTLHTLCMGIGWGVHGFSHLSVHPFPTLHTLSMGIGWALPGFSRLLSTLSPPFIPFAWA